MHHLRRYPKSVNEISSGTPKHNKVRTIALDKHPTLSRLIFHHSNDKKKEREDNFHDTEEGHKFMLFVRLSVYSTVL